MNHTNPLSLAIASLQETLSVFNNQHPPSLHLSLLIPEHVQNLIQNEVDSSLDHTESLSTMYTQIVHSYESVFRSWNPLISHRTPLFLSYIGSRLYNTQLSVSQSDVDLALVYLEDSMQFFGLEVANLVSSKEELFSGARVEGTQSNLPDCLTMDIKIQELQKILEWIHYGNPSASEYLFSCDDVLCVRSPVWDQLVHQSQRELLTQKLCDRFLGFARSQMGNAQGRWQRSKEEERLAEEERKRQEAGADASEEAKTNVLQGPPPETLTWRQRRKLKYAEKHGEAVVSIPQHALRPAEKGRTDWQKPLYHAVRNLFLAKDVCAGKRPQIRVADVDCQKILLRIRRCELTYEEALKLYEEIRVEIQQDKKSETFLQLEEDFDPKWLSAWLRQVRLGELHSWEEFER